jgi:hypothetical protein
VAERVPLGPEKLHWWSVHVQRFLRFVRKHPEQGPVEVLVANAGDSRAYGPDVIHSTAHPEKAWVMRITGTDLDHLPRFHFKKSRDRMVEAAQ